MKQRHEGEDEVMVARPASCLADETAREGSTLTQRDEDLLAFERGQWRSSGAKDAAIRAAFGLSPTAYYLQLARLAESEEAMAYDPLLVQRLQRRIDERSRWQRGMER